MHTNEVLSGVIEPAEKQCLRPPMNGEAFALSTSLFFFCQFTKHEIYIVYSALERYFGRFADMVVPQKSVQKKTKKRNLGPQIV